MVKVKRILLAFEPDDFWRIKKHKMEVEEREGEKITWEDYMMILFGFYKKEYGK